MSKSFNTSRHSRNPSFSSLLLDSIYNSLDDVHGTTTTTDTTLNTDPNPIKKKQNSNKKAGVVNKSINLKGAIMIDQWIDQQQEKKEQKHTPKLANLESVAVTNSSSSCLKIRTTKSRALKIYQELKQRNQQTSPAAKIAAFLNSIFTTTKHKPSSPPPRRASTSASNTSSSGCSSASSFSRSCLTKSTESRTSKKSVKFYPVSVIVGEDARPCGHKLLYESGDTNKARKPAKLTRMPKVGRWNPWCLQDEKEEDGEDAESYASSDLFELENIGGMFGYGEELPVYGTTSFKKNNDIANGIPSY